MVDETKDIILKNKMKKFNVNVGDMEKGPVSCLDEGVDFVYFIVI